MLDCKELYLNINHRLEDIINESLNELNVAEQAKGYNFIEDYDKWIENFEALDETVLYKYALMDYQHALLLVSQGLYRQAFNSLRFCLEHTCFGIYLSLNEYNFRKWKAGQLDVYWSSITGEDSIFSKTFINLFAPELSHKATELITMAKSVYRECSEFTHGNYNITLLLSEELNYDEDLFAMWHEKADTIRYIITIMFFIRYKDYIEKNDLVGALENSIVEYIGTLPEVQAFLEVSKKEE